MDQQRVRGDGILGALGVFISLAGVTASLTVVFLAMRGVMKIGGSCAEGGPFIPVRPCPRGVPGLLIGGIWIGLVFVGLYVWQSARIKAPSLAVFLWPALFLSLGWNFVVYGLHPPFGVQSISLGFMICAVVFFLMGGIPLFFAVPRAWKSFTRGEEADEPVFTTTPQAAPSIWTPPGGAPSAPSIWTAPGGAASPSSPTPWPAAAAPVPAPTWPAGSPQDPTGMIEELERLDSLHSQGALSDREYKKAKKRLLRSGAGA